MDPFGFKCFLLAFMLATSMMARSTTSSSDCKGEVQYIDKPSKREDFHFLSPRLFCNPGEYYKTKSCLFTFRVKAGDELEIMLNQLCTEGFYSINCYSSRKATIIVSNNLKSLKMQCSDRRDEKICAPRGEGLEVSYEGNFLCTGYHDMTQEIKDFLAFYHQPAFNNVIRLATKYRCQSSTNSRKTVEQNGTIASLYKDGGQGYKYCPAYVDLNHRVKEFCVHVIEFDSPEDGASLEISTWHELVRLSESSMKDHTGDFCLPVRDGDKQVSFTIVFTRRQRQHTILLEYYSIFKNDDDDDDDNDDLYWLFVIPGVAILSWCCYYCCKEDKDENGVQNQPGEESEGQAPPEALGTPNEHNRDGGNETIHLTVGAAEPSAPPLIEPPPPPFAYSGDEPPSYHLLFPNQKQ